MLAAESFRRQLQDFIACRDNQAILDILTSGGHSTTAAAVRLLAKTAPSDYTPAKLVGAEQLLSSVQGLLLERKRPIRVRKL